MTSRNRTGPSGSDPSAEGFSLIELMMVMVILALVLATAVPNFVARNSAQRVEGDARELSSRLSVARQMAVATRDEYRLVLNNGDYSYYFERRQNDSTWVRDPNRVFTATGISAMTSSANGDPAVDQIHLEAKGTVRSGDAPLEVHFISPRGDTATVVLVRTGRTTVRLFRAGS